MKKIIIFCTIITIFGCSKSVEQIQIENNIERIKSLEIGDIFEYKEVIIGPTNDGLNNLFLKIERTYANKNITCYTICYSNENYYWKQITFTVNKNLVITEIKF